MLIIVVARDSARVPTVQSDGQIIGLYHRIDKLPGIRETIALQPE